MIDEKEIEWWMNEYPSLDREDIIWVLEEFSDIEINIENDD